MIGKEIGPYRIVEKIGQGGMGIVYKGVHVKLDQEVAIKVLAPEYSQATAMRERFINEAKIQAKLSHPNVVNILNYVEDDTNLYLVMEYIPGETLESRLARTGRVDNPVAICVDVLSALEYMHSRGFVHRDIKPGNIMLLEDGSAKLMDFGVAKIAGQKGQTQTGMRLGTLWYMSPEQVLGEEASVSSDIYSVGVTLYHMATGEVPYHSDSDYQVMKAHLEEQPTPPWEINSQLSHPLGRIILKALEKDKNQRFLSAGEFADALLAAAQGKASDEPQGTGAVPVVKKLRLPAIKLTSRRTAAVGVGVGVALAATGLFVAVGHKEEAPPIPAAVVTTSPAPLVEPQHKELPAAAPLKASATPDVSVPPKEEPDRDQQPSEQRDQSRRRRIGTVKRITPSTEPAAPTSPKATRVEQTRVEPPRPSNKEKTSIKRPQDNEGKGWEIR